MRPQRWKPVAAAVIAAVGLSACVGGKGGASGDGLRVSSLDGDARVRRDAGGEWQTLLTGMDIPTGASIRVTTGALTLTRASTTVEVRPSEQGATAEVTVADPARLDVMAGDVLVAADPSAPLAVASQGVGARAERGVFRFDRRLSVRVGVYEGAASVEVPEGDLPVPALREGVVSGRVLPRAPAPYSLREDDEWDRRLLGEVIALDAALRQLALGYERQFGERIARVRTLQPIERDAGVSLSFLEPLLPQLSAGDVLAGVALAVQLQRDGRGQTEGLFRELLDLFDQGATWGLLARERGVEPDVLRSGVERAIALLVGEVRPQPRPSPTRTAGPSPRPSPSPTKTTGPSPSPSPTGTKGPPREGVEPPTGVAAQNQACRILSATEVGISWTASPSADADGYEVMRAAAAGGPYTVIGSVRGRGTTTFTDAGVEFSKTYYYVVRATAGSKRSVSSNEASVTTPNNLCV